MKTSVKSILIAIAMLAFCINYSAGASSVIPAAPASPPTLPAASVVTVVQPCPDLNGNGVVDLSDYVNYMMMAGKRRGEDGYDPKADFDRDGLVGGPGTLDLTYFKTVFGTYFTCGSPVYASCAYGNADIDGNGRIDLGDLVLYTRAIGKRFGESGFNKRADFNGDGMVGGDGSVDMWCFNKALDNSGKATSTP